MFLSRLWRRLQGRRRSRRGLFSYWDGTRTRWADPIRLYRELFNHPAYNLQRDADDADELVEPATTNVIKLTCEVFGVQRWDDLAGRGLLDQEILALFPALAAHLEEQKKTTASGSTSSPPTDSESSICPEPPAATTPSSSPSTPAATGSTPNGNTSSAAGSATD